MRCTFAQGSVVLSPGQGTARVVTMSIHPSVLCIGPICVDHLHFQASGRERFYPGGNAVIASSILAKSGLPTAIAGQVGEDAWGTTVRKLLHQHGVDTTHLHSTHTPTKIARLSIKEDGDWHKISSHPETFPYLSVHFDTANVSHYSHLHVGGINSLLRAAPRETQAIIEASRRYGNTVSIGLASGDVGNLLSDLIDHDKDMILCNRSEFSQLFSMQFDDSASLVEGLIESRIRNCIITLGAAGSMAKWAGSTYCHLDAWGVNLLSTGIKCRGGRHRLLEAIRTHRSHDSRSKIVSTVGAGDVFSAVLLAFLISGSEIGRALQAAARAASASLAYTVWDGWSEQVVPACVHT